MSRREAEPDLPVDEEEEYINLNEGYGSYESKDIWSYGFSIKDIDDF